MAGLKTPLVGVYGDNTRALQRRLAFEKVSLTWKTVNVYKYKGDATESFPQVTDIHDPLFLETPDRAYETNPIEINAWYEFLPETPFDLSKFGIINPLGNTQQFRFHIDSFAVDGLGRYIMAGDIIEVPFLEQDGEPALWEVTDVDRKPEFENYFVVVTTVPVDDSQETEEIDIINSNESILKDVSDAIVTDADAMVDAGGLDPEPYLFIERGFIEDGFFFDARPDTYTDETAREDYDPRPDAAEDFLDSDTSIKF